MPGHGNRYIRYILPCGVLFTCSIVMLYASLTRPPVATVPDTGTAPGAPQAPSVVSARYKQFCASCHGIDGQGFGTSAYDEVRGEFVGDLHDHRPANLTCPGIGLTSYEDLGQVVRGGISCKTHGQVMPAFPDLTEAQFTEIADQVRVFAHQHLGHDPDRHK